MVNAARLLGTFTVGSSQWHAARRLGLGGSEVASAVGLSPWKSRWTLWQEKAGNLQPPQGETFKLWLGSHMEQVVVDAWKQTSPGRFCRRTGMWVNRERPFQFAEPDRLIVASQHGRAPIGILEAKTADIANAFEWGKSGGSQDDIPPYYYTQVLWYMSCLDIDMAQLAVIVSAREYREYSVARSRQDEDWLVGEAEKFMASIEAGTPPLVDSSQSTYEAIRTLHPDIKPSEDVTISADLANKWAQARGELEAAKKADAQYRNEVADLLGMGQTAWVSTVDGKHLKVASRRSAREGAAPSLYPVRNLSHTIF